MQATQRPAAPGTPGGPRRQPSPLLRRGQAPGQAKQSSTEAAPAQEEAEDTAHAATNEVRPTAFRTNMHRCGCGLNSWTLSLSLSLQEGEKAVSAEVEAATPDAATTEAAVEHSTSRLSSLLSGRRRPGAPAGPGARRPGSLYRPQGAQATDGADAA